MWDAQPPPISADVARANAELAAAKRGPGWPYGKRDITPTEAQKLVDVAKLLAKKQVPYGLHGRASDLQEADCTGAVGLMYDLVGKKYEGVWSTQWFAGEKDFHDKFRKVDIEHGEQLQKGDVIVRNVTSTNAAKS
jgi:cell wall-associated NlpC family hydrolase